MYGTFGIVQRKLKDSIRSLGPDQYFNVIFFGDERLLSFRDDAMVRASPSEKAAASRFVDGVSPAGRTNFLTAMRKALTLRDSLQRPPQLIYLLTDGFELSAEDAEVFSAKIEHLIDQSATEVIINSIGFVPQPADREMLQRLAIATGGEFVEVGAKPAKSNN
jgi:Mg-chelatase subunit ChlD